jgi:hypothetical protein
VPQAQLIFLCSASAPPTAAAAAQLGGSVVAVLLVDDLCGRVRVGDRVLATGSGRYYGGCSAAMAPNAHLPVTLGVQVGAGGVEFLCLLACS